MKLHWDIEDLIEHFTLIDKDKDVLENKAGATLLGCVLSLHLLQVCLVYVNTPLIQQVLADPKHLLQMKKEICEHSLRSSIVISPLTEHSTLILTNAYKLKKE